MVAGSVVVREALRPVELCGGVLVMAGLAVNFFRERLPRRRTAALR
jgi:hypothetical protein